MPVVMDGAGEPARRLGWHKNLYEKQGYPDNYTDISFLEELRKNVNPRQVTFCQAFLGSTLITQQLTMIVFFSLHFFYIYNEWVSSSTVFLASCLVTAFGYLAYLMYAETPNKQRHLRALVEFLVLGYLLSPVLKTLTESISTDTIYAMSTVMMIIHLIFYDYGVKVLIVSSSLSLNAAVFACLCLSSRLATPFDSFVLMSSAVIFFLLCPLLLGKLPSRSHTPLLLCLLCIAVYGLSRVSQIVTVLFLAGVVFLNLVCPYLFVRWHAYKDNIYGPWDEAVVKGFG